MTAFVPVVDISKHQGDIDFATMKSRGVEGLIVRACHGPVRDPRLDEYVHGTSAVGVAPAGLYEFVNPKRGTPEACADAFVEIARSVVDLDRTFLMLDVENYVAEPPDPGSGLSHEEFSAWLWAHLHRLRELTTAPIIGYSNASLWATYVDDRDLAAELEWIAARFPVWPPASALQAAKNGVTSELDAWIAASPKPPDPTGWSDFANTHGPTGPKPPLGAAGWQGWQFSAGYNRQGASYGCSSIDLDLNIVRPDAWARWQSSAAPAPVNSVARPITVTAPSRTPARTSVAPPSVAPASITAGGAGTRKDTGMLVLSFGVPVEDSWFNQIAIGLDGVRWVTGTLAAIVNRSDYPATPVDEDEVEALLTPIGCFTRVGTPGVGLPTRGPSPYVDTGVAPNAVLHSLWCAAAM